MISAEQLVKTLYPISRASTRATAESLAKHVKRIPMAIPDTLDSALAYPGTARWLALWWDVFDEDWVWADGHTERHVPDAEGFPRFLKEGPLWRVIREHRNVAVVYDRLRRDGFVIAQGDAMEFLQSRVRGQLDRVARVLMTLRQSVESASAESRG